LAFGYSLLAIGYWLLVPRPGILALSMNPKNAEQYESLIHNASSSRWLTESLIKSKHPAPQEPKAKSQERIAKGQVPRAKYQVPRAKYQEPKANC
jgi:hypothetical protein